SRDGSRDRPPRSAERSGCPRTGAPHASGRPVRAGADGAAGAEALRVGVHGGADGRGDPRRIRPGAAGLGTRRPARGGCASVMSRVVITGASGFVGSQLCRTLREEGWPVLGLSRRAGVGAPLQVVPDYGAEVIRSLVGP